MEEATQFSLSSPIIWLGFIANLIFWLIGLPIRAAAWTITSVRAKMYDPEKAICPGCGFRGDRGTAKKTCIIKFVRTETAEKASIQHTCLRCSAPFFSKIFLPAEKWISPIDENKAAKIKQAAKSTTL